MDPSTTRKMSMTQSQEGSLTSETSTAMDPSTTQITTRKVSETSQLPSPTSLTASTSTVSSKWQRL